MIWENVIETCIISYKKRIARPGSIQDSWGWCTGMTRRDGTGREVGGGFRMGNTCMPMPDSCWCVAEPIQYCKGKKKKKELHSICQQIWKTQQWPQDWKRSVFIQIPKKGNAKECSNYCTIVLISHASKVMLKTLQARLQQYMNRELPDVQAGFRKGRGTRDQIAIIRWIIKKAREFQISI